MTSPYKPPVLTGEQIESSAEIAVNIAMATGIESVDFDPVLYRTSGDSVIVGNTQITALAPQEVRLHSYLARLSGVQRLHVAYDLNIILFGVNRPLHDAVLFELQHDPKAAGQGNPRIKMRINKEKSKNFCNKTN